MGGTVVERRRRLALVIASLWAAALIAGCGGGGGGGGSTTTTTTATDTVHHAQITQASPDGTVLAEHLSYTTFDGSKVPALFSVPRAYPARGCLIFENGFGSTKEGTEVFWKGAARLGLAIFAIDLRDLGQRASNPNEQNQVVREPAQFHALVAGTEKDLRYAVDYLWNQPVCRHNIGYLGQSLGGMIGSVEAASDPRIHAVVLISVPPTYRAITRFSDILFPNLKADPAQLTAALAPLSPYDPDRYIGRIAPRHLLLMFGDHDPIVRPPSARGTIAAARPPVTVVHYNGGHSPYMGAAAASNAQDIGQFFLKYLVEPTFGLKPIS